MTLTTPSITAGASKTFISSGTNVLTLFNVSSEETRKTTGVIEMPMPMSHSSEKFVYDLMGASREVTMKGKVTTADVGTTAGRTNLWKHAQDLIFGLIDANQGDATTGQYLYAHDALSKGSPVDVTVYVLVSEVTIEATKGNPDSFDYSINMTEFGTLI